MMTVWVYKVHPDYLIVKRFPFSCQIPVISNTGKMQLEIVHGVSIELPEWDSVRQIDGHILASWKGNIYEISDLFVADQKNNEN